MNAEERAQLICEEMINNGCIEPVPTLVLLMMASIAEKHLMSHGESERAKALRGVVEKFRKPKPYEKVTCGEVVRIIEALMEADGEH